MGGNYIKLDRKITEWEWYKNEHTKSLFLHCLLKANWKTGKFEGMEVPRGSFITSVKKLALDLDLTDDEIRTAMKHLIQTGEITKQTTNKFTVITVSNYDLYQDVPEQIPNKSQTIPKPFPTIEEYKEGEESKEKTLERSPPKKEKPRTRHSIPPTVEEVRAYCEERGNGIDAEQFCDFYQSKNWMVGKDKMTDWQASVRTWEGKRGFKPKPKEPKPQSEQLEFEFPEEDLSYDKEYWDSL